MVCFFPALHCYCYLGDQASTSPSSSTAWKPLTQLVLTQPVFGHRLHAHLLNFSHWTVPIGTKKPYSSDAKGQDTSGICHQVKAEHFQRQMEGHLSGSSENSSKVLHIHFKYERQPPICAASLRSLRSPGMKWPPEAKMITDNAECIKLELQRSSWHIKAPPSLMAEAANMSTLML